MSSTDDSLQALGTAPSPQEIEALVKRHVGSTRLSASAADALLAELAGPERAPVKAASAKADAPIKVPDVASGPAKAAGSASSSAQAAAPVQAAAPESAPVRPAAPAKVVYDLSDDDDLDVIVDADVDSIDVEVEDATGT